MNRKKQQLGEDIQQVSKVIQSKAPKNYTLIFNNLLLNVFFFFVELFPLFPFVLKLDMI